MAAASTSEDSRAVGARRAGDPRAAPAATIDVDEVTASVIDEIKTDPTFAELVAEQLRGEEAFFAVPTEELIAGDETYEVEFKSTARWNLREERKDKRMEDAVVKTDRRVPQYRRRDAFHRRRRRRRRSSALATTYPWSSPRTPTASSTG